MEIYQRRRHSVKDTTIAEVFIDDSKKRFCYTLEDKIREVFEAGKWVWKSIFKVAGKTAFPSGRYKCTLEDSPRFGPNTITIHKVPDYVGIRVHGGNDDGDTEGCPLPGFGIVEDPNGDGGNIAAGTSKPAVEALKKIIGEALARGEEVWWNAVNP